MAYDPMAGSGVASLFPWLEPQIPQQPAPNPQATPMIPALGSFSPMRQPPQLPAPSFQGATYARPQVAANPFAPFDTSAPPVNRTALDTGGGAAPQPGSGSSDTSTGSRIQQALRGVQAPKPPDVQTVRTPPPPQIVPIQGGDFFKLVTSLGISPQEFMRMSQLRLGR
jgi:hypothetical protein